TGERVDSLVGGGSYSRRCPKSRRPRKSLFCWIRWRWKTGVTAMPGRGRSDLFDEVRTLLRPNRLIAARPPVVPVNIPRSPRHNKPGTSMQSGVFRRPNRFTHPLLLIPLLGTIRFGRFPTGTAGCYVVLAPVL